MLASGEVLAYDPQQQGQPVKFHLETLLGILCHVRKAPYLAFVPDDMSFGEVLVEGREVRAGQGTGNRNYPKAGIPSSILYNELHNLCCLEYTVHPPLHVYYQQEN